MSRQDEDEEETAAPNLREIMEQEKEKNIKKKEPKMGRIPKKRQVWPLWRSDTVQPEPKPEKREIYALRKQYQGFKPVQLVVDSAAVDCVMPKKILDTVRINSEAPLKQGEAAKAGINYVAADGGEIPNEGEQEVDMLTKERHECQMTWQIADIQKPLLAVASLAKTGHEVRFRKRDGEIINLHTGKKIHFVKQGELYVVTVWMRAREPDEQGFQRQGKK